MAAAPETLQAAPACTLLVAPPPEGPFDREAALRFLSWEHRGYLEIIGHAHGVGIEDERLRAALGSLAMDVQSLTKVALRVLESGEPMEVHAADYWRSSLDRPERLEELSTLATSQEPIFRGEWTLLEGPGFAVYERLGAYLRQRLAEEREGAR